MGFYEPDGTDFVASGLTRGPWDDRFQHGGPRKRACGRGIPAFPPPG